jgi:hypothetical protein
LATRSGDTETVIKRFLLLASLALAPSAHAALPTPGATYEGADTFQGQIFVTLKVSDRGRKLDFTVRCGIGEKTIENVRIGKKGRFKLDTRDIDARGEFTSKKKAKGTFHGEFCFIGANSWRAKRVKTDAS